jgi:hypothetical protein
MEASLPFALEGPEQRPLPVQLGLEVDIAEKALLPFEGPQGAAHPEVRRHRAQLSPPI